MFNNADFVPLHCHTSFSRLDGLSKIEDFVQEARRMGFRSLAITDHGNVGGWINFYRECTKKKDKKDKEIPYPTIKPIFGEEYYLSRDHLKGGKEGSPDGRKGNRHLLLLAKNQKGYENLCFLSQKSWIDGQYIDPRIDLNLLADHSEGVICSSACLGSVINNNLLHGRYQQAKKVATILKDIFKEDFFLEVMFHGIDAEAAIIPEVIKLGIELGVPVICTNDTHYVRKSQARSQEVLMAMSCSRCLKDPKRIHFPYDEFYLKSAQEMAVMFGTHPEIITNTCAVAERVENFLKTGGMRLPKFEIPNTGIPEFTTDCISTLDLPLNDRVKELASNKKIRDTVIEQLVPKEKTPYEFLTELAWEGMKKLKWDQSDIHCKRLKIELDDVWVAWKNNKMDFATYFLIVWDIVNFAREEGITVGCGRGSGYGSVLLRCLEICYGPDPIAHGLLWERFLAFDQKYTLLDDDWGFDDVEEVTVTAVATEDSDDLEEDRLVEDDSGGVDRY